MEFATKNKKLGTIIFELYYDVVPRTAKNFIELCKTQYQGCKLHRIIPGFCIQGGDYERGDGTGGQSIYGPKFEDENFKIRHFKKGLLSMANSGPDTNGSQFFITLNELPHLDEKHVVFGEIINGIEIIDTIAKYGSEEGYTKETIKIIKCGIL